MRLERFRSQWSQRDATRRDEALLIIHASRRSHAYPTLSHTRYRPARSVHVRRVNVLVDQVRRYCPSEHRSRPSTAMEIALRR